MILNYKNLFMKICTAPFLSYLFERENERKRERENESKKSGVRRDTKKTYLP